MDLLLIDRIYYKVLSMSVNKKIILDQNCHELAGPLNAVNFNKVYTIDKLGIDSQQASNDLVIHKKIKELGAKTPQSGYLFITKNSKHFKNPQGYDILWVPDKINVRDFSESFKQWVINIRKPARNFIFKTTKTRERGGTPYSIEPVKL
jgi:hypothetical protein